MKKSNSRTIAIEAAKIAKYKKSKGVMVFDVRKQVNYCNYITIATVESPPQMRAVENEIISRLKQEGVMRFTNQQMPSKTPSPSWRVLDFGGAVIHIMTPEARKFYSLEKIIYKAKKIKLVPVKKRTKNDKRRNKKRN